MYIILNHRATTCWRKAADTPTVFDRQSEGSFLIERFNQGIIRSITTHLDAVTPTLRLLCMLNSSMSCLLLAVEGILRGDCACSSPWLNAGKFHVHFGFTSSGRSSHATPMVRLPDPSIRFTPWQANLQRLISLTYNRWDQPRSDRMGEQHEKPYSSRDDHCAEL